MNHVTREGHGSNPIKQYLIFIWWQYFSYIVGSNFRSGIRITLRNSPTFRKVRLKQSHKPDNTILYRVHHITSEVKFPHLRTSPSGSLEISRVWSLLPFSIFDMFYGWTLVSRQTDQSCIFTCWFGEKNRELLESNRSKLYLHMLVRGKNPRVARVELLDSL